MLSDANASRSQDLAPSRVRRGTTRTGRAVAVLDGGDGGVAFVTLRIHAAAYGAKAKRRWHWRERGGRALRRDVRSMHVRKHLYIVALDRREDFDSLAACRAPGGATTLSMQTRCDASSHRRSPRQCRRAGSWKCSSTLRTPEQCREARREMRQRRATRVVRTRAPSTPPLSALSTVWCVGPLDCTNII